MDTADLSPATVLLGMLKGYRTTQLLAVVTKLGIIDQLADGPKTADELAALAGAHPDALYRVLRALASLGVFEERDARQFALTPLAAPLQRNYPASLRGLAIFFGDDSYRAWADLTYSVMTGAPAFDHLYGRSHFAYLAEHPEASAIFNQAMSERSRQIADAVAAAYDFTGARTVVDVGGGQGKLLATILHAHPALHGILMDQPHVVAGAHPLLAEAGVADRCDVVGGDFFTEVPSGGDLYLLRHILHDWDDERGGEILRSCARALGPHGKVLVIEAVIEPGSRAIETAMLDVQMMVMNGGRERTAEEYGQLFTSAGLRLTRVLPTQSEASILEGELVAAP